jgi:type II secretory pathway predicted ATPase ExeA
LTRDPFPGGGGAYVPLSAHEEAVARLVHTIETGQRVATVRAPGGMGKSMVLARALAATRSPTRRVAHLASPCDGAGLFAGLAEGLGVRVPAEADRARTWRALGDAVRLGRWQRQHIVLAIDDCDDLDQPRDRLDLERLVHLDPHPEARLTILRVFRAADDSAAEPWELAICLPTLTRREAAWYLSVKLAAAGRTEPIFAPRAVSRLHARSAGVPRGLDRLAELALVAGAALGLEIITPEVIDGVAHECVIPA